MADEHGTERFAGRDGRPVPVTENPDLSPSTLTWRPLVQPGMYVLGVAGEEIGQVKETRPADFLVDRSASLGLATDTPICLPYERIHAMMGDRITLDVPGDQVEEHATIPGPISQ